MLGQYLKTGHDHFIPCSSKLIIHNHTTIRSCIGLVYAVEWTSTAWTSETSVSYHNTASQLRRPRLESLSKTHSLHPEDGGNIDLWNVGILPQHYTASQPRRHWLESWLSWKSISHCTHCFNNILVHAYQLLLRMHILKYRVDILSIILPYALRRCDSSTARREVSRIYSIQTAYKPNIL
jgi:hypothetical protein